MRDARNVAAQDRLQGRFRFKLTVNSSRRSPTETELHPGEKHEPQGDRDAQGDGSKTRTLELVNDCQQKKSQTDGQIPPSPVSRLKSAHSPIVDQTTARWNPGVKP
jgi:hypothetical protein